VSLYGGLSFDHRGSKHTAPSGVISVIDPCEVHNAYGVAYEWGFIGMLIPLEVARTVVSEVSGSDRLPGFAQRVICDPQMASCVIKLHNRLEQSTDALERQSVAVSTLAEFFQRHSSAPSRTTTLRSPIRRAIERIHSGYAEPISLRELADCAGLSQFHFLRVFFEQVGLTPHAYLNQVRLQKAKSSLAAGTLPAQVALECGFFDQSHLVRVFKRALGVTPGQYQKML
jgi:AraC-like DNA-binding protein